jgi:hypothetical protein
MDSVAKYVLGCTKTEAAPPETEVPDSQANDRVFAATIPGAMVDDLSCLGETEE